MTDRAAHLLFPRWIEASGLPQQMAEETKNPHAYWLFRKLIELDIDHNRRAPGVVEISPKGLGGLTGLHAGQVDKAVKKLRGTKSRRGWVRCFLPDHEEEPGLFQIVTPLETPTPWEVVRECDALLRDLPDSAFRYATPTPEEAAGEEDGCEACEGGARSDPKIRAVVDLYFDNVSMKMNSFILDELRLIAMRYDPKLIEAVFQRARKKEIQNLGWILKEIRREKGAGKDDKQPGGVG
ncbi:MAG: hypothetical protein RLY93_06315 [Sumerlaeia bacterium]